MPTLKVIITAAAGIQAGQYSQNVCHSQSDHGAQWTTKIKGEEAIGTQ